MVSMNLILKLTDAAGTSITLKGHDLDAVLREFHDAWVEQRMMDVGMNTPGYTHRINPQQVALIQTLEH